jgi:ABC-type transporter Mla MlaB component
MGKGEVMLRINKIDNGEPTIFRLEGNLAGVWVDELERFWRDTKALDPTRKFQIDVTDVQFVDEEGKVLLERMLLEGAELHPGNPFMTSVVADIVEHSTLVRVKY